MTATQSSRDYRNSCRLCLSKGGRQLSIFGPTIGGFEPLRSRILACLSIEVHEHDDLPKHICHRCECQVNIWHYFKEECESSQQKLRNWHRTISRSSTHTDVFEEENDIAVEAASVKLEPEDDNEFRAEDCFNLCADPDNLIVTGDRPPLEGADSIHDESMDCGEELCQSESHAETPEFPSSWTPIISGTSTVALEDCSVETRYGVEGIIDGGANHSAAGCDHDLQPRGVNKGSGGPDARFIRSATPRRAVEEVDLDNSNDAAPQVPSNNLNYDLPASPEFMTLNVSSLNVSSLSTGAINDERSEDPLVGLKEEPLDANELLSKVKEEPAETAIESELHCQDDPSYLEQLATSTPSTSIILQDLLSSSAPLHQPYRNTIFKTSVPNLSENSASKTKKTCITKQSASSTGNDQVYNYASVDLPKISNDIFDEETKYCKICQKSYLNSNLWRHIKDRHAEENPFKCGACEKIFSGRRELVTHRVRTIDKSCRAGKKPAVDVSNAIIIFHENISRGKRGRYECRECRDKFVQLSSIKAHVRMHTGERPYFCYKCNDKEFRLRKSALKHVSVCRGKCDNPLPVSIEKSKLLPDSLKVSNVMKHKSVRQIFNSGNKKCTKCGKVFTNGTGFSNHLRVECVRKCFSCAKFVPKKVFHKHYRQCFKSVHSPTTSLNSEGMPISSPCSKSSKTQTYQDSSASSSVSKRNNEESRTSSKIDSRIITKFVDEPVSKLWEKHVDKEGKLLSLVCQLCNKTMGSRNALRAHLMKHSTKTFKCDLCNIRMSLRSTYESHMSNFHEGYLKVPKVDLNFAKGDLPSSSGEVDCNGSQAKPMQSKFSGFKTPKLKCEICLKLFSSTTSLKYHKQSHKRVKCQRCEITFPATMEKNHICTPKVKVEPPNSEQELTVLQIPVLPEKVAIQYTCHLCKKKFHTRKMLYQHKKMHIKMKIYKCKICGNSYSDAGALQQHKVSDHANELALQSEVNEDQEEKGKVDLLPSISPVVKDEVSKPWKCTVCNKSYTKKDSLSRHMKLHKTRAKLSDGTQHVIALQKPHEPGIFCNICDKAFPTKSSFIRHKGWHSRQESGNSSVSSLKSDTSVSSNDKTLISGLEGSNVSTPADKTFDCDICSKRFSTQKGLKCHAVCHDKVSHQVVIKKETLYSVPLPQTSTQHKCKICSKIFTDPSLLSMHIGTHSENSDSSSSHASVLGDTPKTELLQCKLCNKEYKCRKSLKYHMMGHSGEKPYKCRSCSNQYSNPKALAKHEKERHPIILRPFSCNRCKTSFVLKEDLIAHHEKCTH